MNTVHINKINANTFQLFDESPAIHFDRGGAEYVAVRNGDNGFVELAVDGQSFGTFATLCDVETAVAEDIAEQNDVDVRYQEYLDAEEMMLTARYR